jgi:uncharacterized protein YndB with AHSA1/START domain
MIRIRSSVTIQCPVEAVFDWVHNPERHTHWQLGLVEVAHFPAERRIVEVRRLLGRRIEHVMEIVEHEPNRLIRHRGGADTHNIDRLYTFEEANGGTRLTVEVDMSTVGVFAMATPTLERMLKRQIDGSLQHLKDMLEAHPELDEMARQLPLHDSAHEPGTTPGEPAG